MKISEVVSIVESLKNPYPVTKKGTNAWQVNGDRHTWLVTAGSVEVQPWPSRRPYVVATASFSDEFGSFNVTGKSTSTEMLRLCATIMQIVRNIHNLDIIAFSPTDKDQTNTDKKERIYSTIGRQVVATKQAIRTGTLAMGGLGKVVYVIPVGSKAGALTDPELEEVIAEAWGEKINPDASIADIDVPGNIPPEAKKHK
jgi:hypothetical protein